MAVEVEVPFLPAHKVGSSAGAGPPRARRGRRGVDVVQVIAEQVRGPAVLQLDGDRFNIDELQADRGLGRAQPPDPSPSVAGPRRHGGTGAPARPNPPPQWRAPATRPATSPSASSAAWTVASAGRCGPGRVTLPPRAPSGRGATRNGRCVRRTAARSTRPGSSGSCSRSSCAVSASPAARRVEHRRSSNGQPGSPVVRETAVLRLLGQPYAELAPRRGPTRCPRPPAGGRAGRRRACGASPAA